MPQKHFSLVWHKTIKELDNPPLRKNNPLFKGEEKKKKSVHLLDARGHRIQIKIKVIDKNKTNVSHCSPLCVIESPVLITYAVLVFDCI